MEQDRGGAGAEIMKVELHPADRDYGMNPQSFQRSNHSNLRLDGFGIERSVGFIHLRSSDEIGSRSGFLPLRSRAILSGLAVPSDNPNPEFDSENIDREGILLPVSSAILVSQNLVKPNKVNGDGRSVDLEVPDVALRNLLASHRVPVPMQRIALQGFYVFR